jgi:hypothetical protein
MSTTELVHTQVSMESILDEHPSGKLANCRGLNADLVIDALAEGDEHMMRVCVAGCAIVSSCLVFELITGLNEL